MVFSQKSAGEYKMSDCKKCGSDNTYGMSRVVGYYSIIENWNDSKKAEFDSRQIGDYAVGKTNKVVQDAQTCEIEQKVLLVS